MLFHRRGRHRFVFVALLNAALLLVLSTIGSASDPKIIEAAKKEAGPLNVYAAMRLETTSKMWNLFHAKYPFLTVNQYKADTDKMLQRVLTEYRAGKYLVDVLNFAGFHPLVLLESGVAGLYESPEAQYFKPVFKGKNGAWTDIYYNPLTINYNTNLVTGKAIPRDWPDLLHPQWKGKLGIEKDHIAWYAGILKRYGEEKGRQFMQALAKQEPRVDSSSRGNALLVAGEFPIFIGRGGTAEIFKQRGAPIDWVRNPDPLVVQPGTIQIAKHPVRPNGAKLLIDFWLSEPIANLLADNERIPARSGIRNLAPAFKEIDVDKIFPLTMAELRNDYRKHLDGFRSFFK